MWQVPSVPGAQRLEPIDWNLVAVLDADLIRKTRDYDSLQKLMQIFLTARITQGNSRILVHPLVVRLCQLLQVGVEYLNYCQHELEAKVSKLESQSIAAEEKLTIEHRHRKKIEHVLKKKCQPYSRCPVCNKKFENMDYVDRHILNRHRELESAWNVIRGRKNPEAIDSVQQILDKMDSLRNTLKRDQHNKQKIQDELLQTQKELMDAEEIRDEESMRKREEIRQQFFMAADDLNSSMELWKEQRSAAPPKIFNIFQDKPSRSEVPREMPQSLEGMFGKQPVNVDLEGPKFNQQEPIFSYNDGNKEPPPTQQEENDVGKFPRKYSKDVLQSARNFVAHQGHRPIAKPDLEKVMNSITEKVQLEMARIKAGSAKHNDNGEEYAKKRAALQRKLEEDYPLRVREKEFVEQTPVIVHQKPPKEPKESDKPSLSKDVESDDDFTSSFEVPNEPPNQSKPLEAALSSDSYSYSYSYETSSKLPSQDPLKPMIELKPVQQQSNSPKRESVLSTRKLITQSSTLKSDCEEDTSSSSGLLSPNPPVPKLNLMPSTQSVSVAPS